jgi:biopolymer transport protein ExbB/biopolymer transport protein TolQ
MVATGLEEFRSAPLHASSTEMIDAAERGLDRSVATIHAELKRGLSGLATIGSTAPFVGLFGTVVGIMNAFRASAPVKAAGIQSVASGISEALVTTALGLLVAVPAVWCYNYFTTKVENFDVEMENSSMELVSYLVRRAPRETSLP